MWGGGAVADPLCDVSSGATKPGSAKFSSANHRRRGSRRERRVCTTQRKSQKMVVPVVPRFFLCPPSTSPVHLLRFSLHDPLSLAPAHTMQEAKRRSSAMLRTALAVCSLQLLSSTPTANATSGSGARRTLYYQDGDCRLETFREFAYDAISIEETGVQSQGAKDVRFCCLAGVLRVLVGAFPPSVTIFFSSRRFWPLMIPVTKKQKTLEREGSVYVDTTGEYRLC